MVYYFLRNGAFDARDFFNYGPFFNRRERAETSLFRQHLYGGTVSGIIRNDQDFFFINYEGFDRQRDVTFRSHVPNAALINLVPGNLGTLSLSYEFRL